MDFFICVLQADISFIYKGNSVVVKYFIYSFRRHNKMNITVVGLGYVGFSIAVLLSQNHKVVGLDISKERVHMINSKKSPIKDKEIEELKKIIERLSKQNK